MLKAYKYRIYPNNEQKTLMAKTFGCCRLIYNLALETKIRLYKDHKISLSAFDLINQFSELKKDKEYEWLNEPYSHSIQSSIRQVGTAFNNFFKNDSGFPKYKKRCNRQSFSCPDGLRKIDFEKSLLTIPKIPNIPIQLDGRKIKGKIRTVTISKTPTDKYFASILVDNERELPQKQPITPATTIGIDLGIADLAILNDGRKFNNPKFLKQALERLKILQRRASKKKKSSNNQKKAYKLVAAQHEKVRNRRQDNLHKLSTMLVRENQAHTFCIEDLAVSNMAKNHNLAFSISDVGWSEFIRMLKYKCEWVGKNVVVIGRFEKSTKTCSECNAVNDTLTLKDREWLCGNCGTLHDRDVNAARNIKNMGLEKILKSNGEEENRAGHVQTGCGAKQNIAGVEAGSQK